MKAYKITGFIALIMGAAMGARAQSNKALQLDLNYSYNMPIGRFRDFISNNSPRGWTASLLYGVNRHISVGLGTGYQDYYQKYPRAVYKLSDGSDVSAVVSNSLQTLPILAEGQYHFLPNSAVQPYVALGVGGNLVFYRQYLGAFEDSKTKFEFAARPGAGVFVPFNRSKEWGVTVGGSFNYMPFNYGDIGDLHNWGLQAGLRFPLK